MTSWVRRLFVGLSALPALACSDRDPLERMAPSPARASRAETIARHQAEGSQDARYHVSRATPATLEARSPHQNLFLRFSEAGAEVKQPSWRLALQATHLVCGTERLPLRPALPTTDREPHRVSYARQAAEATIEEWYVNGPLGLEQGFTLERSPCPAGLRELGIEVAFDGLAPELSDDGQSVVLRDARGITAAHYSDWFGWDALGRALPVALQLTPHGVALEVNVAGATWPVVIDP